MTIENILKQIPIDEIAIIIRIIRIERERINNPVKSKTRLKQGRQERVGFGCLPTQQDNKFEIIREAGMMKKELKESGVTEDE